MNRLVNSAVVFGWMLLATRVVMAEEAKLQPADVYPTAICSFAERGANVKDYGSQVTDLLFANLAADPTMFLVDREELNKVLTEQSLGATGLVKSDEAAQLGQLTGAKILITGSVMQVDRKIFIVAKIMGTETTRVVAASVNGKSSDELAPLVADLAKAISKTIGEQKEKLVAAKARPEDRVKRIRKEIGDVKLPPVMVEIDERHIGQPTIDPAAETEVAMLSREAGFELVDPKTGSKNDADVLITGEGFSEVAGRVGSLYSVKARVEVKAVDRATGKVLAVDRQTAVVVDSTEQFAGKAALQEASAALAERMLPKLAKLVAKK